MHKSVSGTVSRQDNGLKLEQFLKNELHLSKNEISRAKFRENGICVNGKRRRIDFSLKAGDLVEILLETGDKTSESLTASEGDIFILYEDEDVIVLDKPAGISVHPAGCKDTDTLANRLAFYLRNKKEDSVIRIFGRLDRDTSGIVLAAKKPPCSHKAGTATEKRHSPEKLPGSHRTDSRSAGRSDPSPHRGRFQKPEADAYHGRRKNSSYPL